MTSNVTFEELAARTKTFITPQQAMALLKVGRTTIYDWLERGVLPGTRLGSKWFVSIDGMADALERGRNDRRPPPDQEGPPAVPVPTPARAATPRRKPKPPPPSGRYQFFPPSPA